MTDDEAGVQPAAHAGSRSRGRLPLWRDAALRRRFINIGHLLSGNGVNGLIALVGVAMTARSLGPVDYGILALVISYIRVFDRLMRFESWQPLIKYAAQIAQDGQDRLEQLRALFAFGLWLDVGACVAAAVLASLIAVLFAPLLGMQHTHILLVCINAITLLFNISGMPTAVLRLAGRFRTIAYVQVTGSIVRILLCAIGLWVHGGLIFFIWVWTISQIVSSLLFLIISLLELKRQGVVSLHRMSMRGITDRFPGIMGFAWSSSLSTSLRTSTMALDVLIVGALADHRSAGLYFVAKQVAKVVQQVCAQVQAVLYPDVARLWAEGALTPFRGAIMQVQVILDVFAVGAIVVLAIGGRWLITLTMGHAFADTYPLLLVQTVALAFIMHAAPLRSALLAMGEQRAVLHIVLWSTLAFQVIALTLVPVIGAMGANVAHVFLAVTSAIAMEWTLRHRFTLARAGSA
ncbi:MAG: oligosaccharide flippase family protein [Sphingobium sp.]